MDSQRSSHRVVHFVLCFSSRDAAGKAELAAHLSPLRGTLTSWSVDDVPPGESIADAFLRAAAGADAAVFLLSADFFAELDVPAFAEQVEHLRQQQTIRGLKLIPILWRDCQWQAVPWLAGLKPLPLDGHPLRELSKRRRDRAFAKVARLLDRQVWQTRPWVVSLSSLLLAGLIGITMATAIVIRNPLVVCQAGNSAPDAYLKDMTSAPEDAATHELEDLVIPTGVPESRRPSIRIKRDLTECCEVHSYIKFVRIPPSIQESLFRIVSIYFNEKEMNRNECTIILQGNEDSLNRKILFSCFCAISSHSNIKSVQIISEDLHATDEEILGDFQKSLPNRIERGDVSCLTYSR